MLRYRFQGREQDWVRCHFSYEKASFLRRNVGAGWVAKIERKPPKRAIVFS